MGAETFIETTTYLTAAVIDLDPTFLIQLGVFLLLYVLLSQFFFKPYTRYLARRDESTAGLRVRAREMTNHADSLEQSTASRLEDARQAGIAERKRITADASALRDRLIAQERASIQERIDREVASINAAKAEFLESADGAIAEVAAAIQTQVQAAERGDR